jgi:putative sigma-54 modulation protein
MKLQIHSIRFVADQKLISIIEKKLNKLETFYEVFLKIENDDARENKILEVKMNIPGEQLFVKSKSKSFEIAADEASEALRRQLKKFKEKQNIH